MTIAKLTRQTAGFFLLLEAVLFYFLVVRGKSLFGGVNAASIGAAAGLALALILAAPLLRPVFTAILRGSQVIGRVFYGLVAGLVFFLILTPIALGKRLVRRPALQVPFEPDRATYFEPWSPPEDIRKQY